MKVEEHRRKKNENNERKSKRARKGKRSVAKKTRKEKKRKDITRKKTVRSLTSYISELFDRTCFVKVNWLIMIIAIEAKGHVKTHKQ